ncbi:zona pellucida sperm-binding protein 3-like [Brachionichthys hirsutus]|uniref:zona pellucida sperm-binding protein 3-like n=1 Tax=Brachionichthys hirsutus TaxID=412623 RepID=UPI0036044B71
MFGTGQFINPSNLKLGPCVAVAEDADAQLLIFETELHGCGSTKMMTEDILIYSYILNYDPTQQTNIPVMRTNKAAITVECHYIRKHNVSSLPLNPEWIAISEAKVAEEFLYFTLKLMTDDWSEMRLNRPYSLGDVIRFEASITQYFHVNLHVYVENCVASVSPGTTSGPRYAFIDNNGCFVDGPMTESKSKFLTRTVDNKLQFQLEAFKFPDAESGELYITCRLKATSKNVASAEYRACFYENGWREASGADAACASCDAGNSAPPPFSTGLAAPITNSWSGSKTNPTRRNRDVSEGTMVDWEADLMLGPIRIG